jgi:hypothetical protein
MEAVMLQGIYQRAQAFIITGNENGWILVNLAGLLLFRGRQYRSTCRAYRYVSEIPWNLMKTHEDASFRRKAICRTEGQLANEIQA